MDEEAWNEALDATADGMWLIFAIFKRLSNVAELSSLPTEVPVSEDEPKPHADDIKVEYHPRSNRHTEVFAFEDYHHNQPSAESESAPCDREPWRPFRSRTDFEFAELILEATLNKEQTDMLLKLVCNVQQQPDSFTLTTHAELMEMWEQASKAKSLAAVGITLMYPSIVQVVW